MHERIRRGEPVGHLLGEALDAHALACKRLRETPAQRVVATAEACHQRHFGERERDLDRLVETADSPAAA